MSELNIPGTWAETKLELAGTWGSGGTPLKSKKEFYGGSINWLKTGDLNNSFVSSVPDKITEKGLANIGGKLYPPRTVIMAMYGATIGKLGILDIEVAVNQACACCTTYDEVDFKFLFYWLMTFRKDYIALGQGGAQPNISRKLIYEQDFAIPPKGEQERIVQKIESCFEKIDETEQNLNKVEVLLEKYRESLLAKAFRGELIPQNPDDEPASVLISKIREEREKAESGKKSKVQAFAPIEDDEKPFEIPESWEWVRLGEVLSLKHGYAFKGEYFVEEGENLLLTPGNFLSEGGFKYQGNKNKFYDGPIDNEYVLEVNDLIVAMTDLTQKPPGILGAPALVPRSEFSMLHNQRLGKVITNFQLINKNFLFFYLNTNLYRHEVGRTSSGSTVRHTSPTKIYNALIPIPPVEEQVMIAEALIKLQEHPSIFKSNSERGLNILNKLKEGVLKKAFEGRLVEQIGSEGTGHELLEKILAKKDTEKVSQQDKKTKKKTVKKKVSDKKITKKKITKKKM